MTRYVIRLIGPRALGSRVAGPLLRDVLDVLVEGTRRAVRLHVEGRSTARGAAPRWLASAAGFDVVAIREGSTVLELEAPDLEAPGWDLLDSESPEAALVPAGIGLFRQSLQDAIAGRNESNVLDLPLLDTITGWQRVFDAGVERIEFGNGTGDMTSIDPQDISRVQELRDTTPPDQRVRVAGRLDVLRHHDRAFTLQLENGQTLRGVVDDAVVPSLGGLWGKQVVVSAKAVFKPSGKVQRLEADQILPAPPGSTLWTEEPKSLWSPGDLRLLHQPQGPRSGLNAIIGEWPGDEGDEDIARFLEELS